MKNFSSKFEDHKIPEWYDKYFDYAQMKHIVRQLKANPATSKLDGFFSYETNEQKVVEISMTPPIAEDP